MAATIVKFLLAETWQLPAYVQPFLLRLRELGEATYAFNTELFFEVRRGLPNPLATLSAICSRLELRLRCGARVDRLNSALLAAVKRLGPDVVVVFRGAFILHETVSQIQRMGACVVGYNNDDPLSSRVPPYVWRHFLANVPAFDHLFAYRHKNIADFRRLGARSVSLLRSFYLRDEHYPISGVEKQADVSFVGHWENDWRTECISKLLAHPQIRLRLWGSHWSLAPIAPALQERLGPIRPVFGPGYNLAINQSKISLVFLSALNNDTYTRRCFEIPAAGGFMLAPHTEDLASLFREGTEAEYFRSPDEMLDKILFYLSHDDERCRIAKAGRERLLRDGHEALDRAREMRDQLRHLH